MTPDPITVALLVARLLESLGIPYVIGGSVASTIHGEPRTTLDVDFAIQLDASRIEPLVAALREEFHVTTEGVSRAVEGRTACNAIHRRSMVKVDLYVRPAEGLYASEIERARRVALRPGEDSTVCVASPEDTVLQKLRWHAQGGGVSTQQWRDVLGVVKAQAPHLDRAYLDEWAARLGLTDALARAFEEAGA